MALKTLTFLLAATGAAVAVYRLGQRAALEGGSLAQTGETGGADEFAPLDAGTSNEAERLQDLKLVDAGMGSAMSRSDDLLAPPRGEEQQSDLIRPGVPDFARGA